MRLDSNASFALNLFPMTSTLFDKRQINNNCNNSNNNFNSLYGVLKQCRSSMGDHLLSIGYDNL